MTPNFPYDVLIIGAGPAGSSAAIRARAAGLSTLVVEKSSFPRFRIGESLLPKGNDLLRELGVWSKIERAGFVEKFGARFFNADGTAEKTVVFAQGLIPGLEKCYQVDRARFDSLLLDHARENGAVIRTATTVRAVVNTPSGFRCELESEGKPSSVNSRWIIDASGRDQFFPNELKAELDPSAAPKRLAIYNHFTGVPRESGPAGGDTVIVRLHDGWFWLIPIDAQRTSVGLVTTAATFKASGLSPSEHFNRVVATTPRLRGLMAGSSPVLEFHVTADYSYYRKQLASGRLILVGDAGGFIDPIFSSGVYLATYSAKLAVDLLVAADRQQRPLTPSECRRYTRDLKAHAGVFRRLIDAFYNDDSFSVFMCPQPPMNLAPGITSIVAGHAALTWSLWWRFKIFLLVCRLQPRFPIVPRINLSTTSPASA
jgi:flavin-dependent dehydrogenase